MRVFAAPPSIAFSRPRAPLAPRPGLRCSQHLACRVHRVHPPSGEASQRSAARVHSCGSLCLAARAAQLWSLCLAARAAQLWGFVWLKRGPAGSLASPLLRVEEERQRLLAEFQAREAQLLARIEQARWPRAQPGAIRTMSGHIMALLNFTLKGYSYEYNPQGVSPEKSVCLTSDRATAAIR